MTNLDKAIRALKRRAAYWRRVASLATKQVDGYRFQDAPLFNATAMGLDEAIAILSRHLKPVPDRGVRRKRRT